VSQSRAWLASKVNTVFIHCDGFVHTHGIHDVHPFTWKWEHCYSLKCLQLEKENAQRKKLNFEQWKESDYQEIKPFGVHHWQRMNISVPDEKFESSQIKVFFHAQNTHEGSNLNFWDWVLCCIPPIPSEILAGLETHRPNKHFWSISCYPCVESAALENAFYRS
jgi:hypothetical protein